MPHLTFVHPTHKTPLRREPQGLRCPETDDFFPLSEAGVPIFVPKKLQQHMEEERTGFVNALKTMLRKFPRLYVALIAIVSPVCLTGLSARKFLKRFPLDALILNIGSGVHKPSTTVLNVDIFPYVGVDVVANAEHLPFAANSVDGILCESLLEHVPHPETIVSEMFRALKPGGSMYIVTPFVYPFHASPNDFERWSVTGLHELFREGAIEEIGIRAGPSSALMAQLTTWTAIALSFGWAPLYEVLSQLLQLVFFPIKFLDLILARLPTSIHGAAQFFAVVRKK